jgi:hypothetical protein
MCKTQMLFSCEEFCRLFRLFRIRNVILTSLNSAELELALTCLTMGGCLMESMITFELHIYFFLFRFNYSSYTLPTININSVERYKIDT